MIIFLTALKQLALLAIFATSVYALPRHEKGIKAKPSVQVPTFLNQPKKPLKVELRKRSSVSQIFNLQQHGSTQDPLK